LETSAAQEHAVAPRQLVLDATLVPLHGEQ
jgi:hypothetical protein